MKLELLETGKHYKGIASGIAFEGTEGILLARTIKDVRMFYERIQRPKKRDFLACKCRQAIVIPIPTAEDERKQKGRL